MPFLAKVCPRWSAFPVSTRNVDNWGRPLTCAARWGGAETAAARDLAADAGSGKHLSYNDVTVTTWRVWPGRSAPHVILRPSVVKMFPVHLRQDFGGVAGGRAVVDGRPFQKDVHCRRFVDVVGVVRRASERARRQDARKYFNRSVRRIYVCVCARALAGGRTRSLRSEEIYGQAACAVVSIADSARRRAVRLIARLQRRATVCRRSPYISSSRPSTPRWLISSRVRHIRSPYLIGPRAFSPF